MLNLTTFRWLCCWAILWLHAAPLTGQTPEVKPDAAPANPKAAVEQLRKALDNDDLALLSRLAVRPHDAALAALAEPFGKARAALLKLDQALKDKPNLTIANPFHAVLHPFSGMQLDLVEIGQEGNRHVARIRFGPRGTPADEEVLHILPEGEAWKVTLPAILVKQLQRLTRQPDQLKREASQLDKLATVLNQLAGEVEKNQIKSKEVLLLRLARLVDEHKLAEAEK